MTLTAHTRATVPVTSDRPRGPKKGLSSLGFGIPAALLLAAMAIYPLVVLFRMSLSDVGPSNIIGVWPFVGFDNFVQALTTADTWKAVLRSIVVSVVLLASNLVLGFIAGSVLSVPGRLTSIVLGLMVFVGALPPLVGGSVWKFLLGDSGAANAVLGKLGIEPVPWLSSPTLALWTVSAVIAWASLPFSALILRGGLLAIPRDIIEAAAIDAPATGELNN
ncbi:MAG: sugar ABC transporter permease [Geodermatophilaceae bacterium]|nr:sugar ABC transporter permease [Geodermatophilaceae bacterium]